MQKVSFHKANVSAYYLSYAGEEILHFSLEGLLSARHSLALNVPLGTLSHIACDLDTPYPRMIAEQQFTASELCVLLPLLKSYPHYCPYEVMLAAFNSGKVTDAAIERARERLQEAQSMGIWDQEMRPVRNVLSRARLKMRNFGIEIASILETGYVLMVTTGRKLKEA